eukprot:6196869-Pleurochrysis_carterae.AAC.4
MGVATHDENKKVKFCMMTDRSGTELCLADEQQDGVPCKETCTETNRRELRGIAGRSNGASSLFDPAAPALLDQLCMPSAGHW